MSKPRKPKTKDTSKGSGNIPVSGPLNASGRKQNPNYYFKDAAQAEEMSRIQMTGFGAINGCIDNHINATVCTMYVNPCPGSTPVEFNSDFSQGTDPNEWRIKGINRAAQKLWYLLTAKSGRSAAYSKVDPALLLLAIGALIEVYEFIRRVFGLFYTYNQRNRIVPTGLWQAMNVDPDDLRANSANYLKRMNSLMAVMNQLPIPGNIMWLAKCQEIYQNVWADGPSEMAQIYLLCPSTTWILEEDDGFVGGTYLRTVDMCVQHEKTYTTLGYNSSSVAVDEWVTAIDPNWMDPANLKHLSDYIDVFEEQINKLLFSSSFATMYADILRCFDDGRLSRWTFDYIDENYHVYPEYNELYLWQLHNATLPLGMASIARDDFQTRYDPNLTFRQNYQYGTPFNDVYQWAKSDVLVYNPRLTVNSIALGGGSYSIQEIDFKDKVLDFSNETPSTEDRVENTRFCIVPFDPTLKMDQLTYSYTPLDAQNVSSVIVAQGWNFPDHWIETTLVFRGLLDKPTHVWDMRFGTTSTLYAPWKSSYTQFTGDPTDDISKFHLFPTLVTATSSGNGKLYALRLFGEINAWARVANNWFSAIAEMIYVDLFDMR